MASAGSGRKGRATQYSARNGVFRAIIQSSCGYLLMDAVGQQAYIVPQCYNFG